MDISTYIPLILVGLVVAATAVLGFVVFFSNPKSFSNKAFLWFCILTIVWGTFNYLDQVVKDIDIALWLLRLSIFFAVWHTFSLFIFLYVFPEDQHTFGWKFKKLLIPITILVAILTLTPFVFNKALEVSSQGSLSKVQNGPGIGVFSLYVLLLVVFAIYSLARKYIRFKGSEERKKLLPVLLGFVLMFALIILFNLVYPSFLGNSSLVRYGGIFIFPFIVGTSYAIFKHKLFDVKVISTAVLVFVLAIITLFEVFVSQGVGVLTFRISEFLLVLVFGVLLIQSVLKEVKQREQLEVLTKELGEANEKLKTLDTARAEFISIASHQLRTPPATIKWYLAALMSGDYGEIAPSVKDIISKAEVTNNSQISLIDDMLNASRIERGTMEFLFEETDIEPLAQLTVDQLTPQALIKKLTLVYHKPKNPLPHIMADKEKLRQVMNNFIDNAIKYTKEGTVTAELFQKGDDVVFQVSDTGKGIAPGQEQSIFEKYSRGKDSVHQAQGLGLGLYVAKIIIAQHKGKIWAESQGENKGSRFIFSIPVHSGVKTTTLLDLSK